VQLFIIVSGNRQNPHARVQNPAAATVAENQKSVLENSQANQSPISRHDALLQKRCFRT